MATTQEKPHARKHPTRLFKSYVVQLVVRAALFLWAIYLFATDPAKLNPITNFGFDKGFSFINISFVLLVLDAVTKLIPHANIAVGSLKQYRTVHLPTAQTFTGGREGLREYVESVRQDSLTIAGETAVGAREVTTTILREADVLKLLPFKGEDLSADEALRRDIIRQRLRETVPVAIFWVVWNGLIAWALSAFGWLTPETAILWMAFYFLFDMICVVFWCPIQLVLMKNRCCTTCQIFNWDAIMSATPLVFAMSWFSGIVIFLALVVLVHWELAFIRHPERFDERTNASLQCANCTDGLCYLRGTVSRKSKTPIE